LFSILYFLTNQSETDFGIALIYICRYLIHVSFISYL
jgi:hypothetical protein